MQELTEEFGFFRGRALGALLNLACVVSAIGLAFSIGRGSTNLFVLVIFVASLAGSALVAAMGISKRIEANRKQMGLNGDNSAIVSNEKSESIDDKFSRLAEEWREQARFMSSITDMALVPAYQQIIGMGRDVVPLLLRELRDDPDYWFWALKAITGADPVPEENRGNISAMAEAWVRWGEQEGYLTNGVLEQSSGIPATHRRQ